MAPASQQEAIRRRNKARSTVSLAALPPAPGLLRRTQTFPAAPGLQGGPSTLFLRRSETYREVASLLDHNYGRAKALLFLVPVAMVAETAGLSEAAVFCLNFAALVPVAPLITFSVLSLTKDAGVAGGLVRAVLGNATEMIVSRASLELLDMTADEPISASRP